MACGILILWPGIEPMASIVGVQSLNHQGSPLNPILICLAFRISSFRAMQNENKTKPYNLV